MKRAHVAIVIALAAIALVATGGLRRFETMRGAEASQRPLPPAQVAPLALPPKLTVAFRLDPELTRGMFMGDRWVTPATYFFAQQGPRFLVQAKPQQIDSHGAHVDLRGDWSVSNPAMVAVTPGPRGEVTLVVRQRGQARVTVATGSGSKVLQVSAERIDGGMQVRITQ